VALRSRWLLAQAARSPRRVGVTKLGSSLLKRTGADARIVSTVDTDGFE